MLVLAPPFSGFAAILGSAAAAPGFGRERGTLSTAGRGHGLSMGQRLWDMCNGSYPKINDLIILIILIHFGPDFGISELPLSSFQPAHL